MPKCENCWISPCSLSTGLHWTKLANKFLFLRNRGRGKALVEDEDSTDGMETAETGSTQETGNCSPLFVFCFHLLASSPTLSSFLFSSPTYTLYKLLFPPLWVSCVTLFFSAVTSPYLKSQRARLLFLWGSFNDKQIHNVEPWIDFLSQLCSQSNSDLSRPRRSFQEARPSTLLEQDWWDFCPSPHGSTL